MLKKPWTDNNSIHICPFIERLATIERTFSPYIKNVFFVSFSRWFIFRESIASVCESVKLEKLLNDLDKLVAESGDSDVSFSSYFWNLKTVSTFLWFSQEKAWRPSSNVADSLAPHNALILNSFEVKVYSICMWLQWKFILHFRKNLKIQFWQLLNLSDQLSIQNTTNSWPPWPRTQKQ